MNKKINSTIMRLENKAKKNSWAAAYQLYEYYLDGKYVEKNYDLAQFYINLAVSHVNSDFIYIDQLSLVDFRALNDLTVNFPNKNLIVLVGENGAGKSSILDGISYTLSWLVNRILYKGGKGKEIDRLDIRENSDKGYSSIITKLNINYHTKINFELCEQHIGSFVNKKSYLNDITKLGLLYKYAGENESSFILPIFAFYGVSRTLEINAKDINATEDFNSFQNNNRFDAYLNSFSGKADIKSFLKWYKRLDDIEKHRATSADNFSSDEELINKLAILAPNDLNARKLLESLKQKNKKNDDSDIWEIKKIKDALNRVVSEFMDGFTDLSIEIEPVVRLTIKKNDLKLNILQLSQGEKSLLALLFDITRRMMTLNPQHDDPLYSPGIIVIDEIDLHLHPKWQRNIASSLQKIFPYCQFIVSTHSPQVISEIRHEQVIMLDKNSEGVVFGYKPEQSYGLTSNEILNELMSNDNKQLIRSKSVADDIDYIFELISNGQMEDAKESILNLEKELNGDIPELISAKTEIELYEWNIENETNNKE